MEVSTAVRTPLPRRSVSIRAQKFPLGQGFAARKGDAPLALVKGLILQNFPQQFFRGYFPAAGHPRPRKAALLAMAAANAFFGVEKRFAFRKRRCFPDYGTRRNAGDSP